MFAQLYNLSMASRPLHEEPFETEREEAPRVRSARDSDQVSKHHSRLEGARESDSALLVGENSKHEASNRPARS